MERYVAVLLLQIVVLAFSFQAGESIKCYICTSATDENCKDPINISKLEPTECSPSGIQEMYESLKKGLKGLTSFMGTEMKDLDIDFACQKTDVSDEEGNTFTVRGCTMAKSEGVDACSVVKAGQIEKLFKKKVKVDFCDVCDHDLCNGAKHLSFNTMMLITVPCLVLILSIFNI